MREGRERSRDRSRVGGDEGHEEQEERLEGEGEGGAKGVGGLASVSGAADSPDHGCGWREERESPRAPALSDPLPSSSSIRGKIRVQDQWKVGL